MKTNVWAASSFLFLVAASVVACGQSAVSPCDKLTTKFATCGVLDNMGASTRDDFRASCTESLGQQEPACQDAFASWVDCVDAISDPALTARLATCESSIRMETGGETSDEELCKVESGNLEKLCPNMAFSGYP